MCVSCSAVSDFLQTHGLWSVRLLCPWSSPGKNTGVSCHSLLQGIFSMRGSNPDLLHCRQILYHLSHQSHKYTFPSACPSFWRELFLPIPIFNLVLKKKIDPCFRVDLKYVLSTKTSSFSLRLKSYSALHYRHSISELPLFLL